MIMGRQTAPCLHMGGGCLDSGRKVETRGLPPDGGRSGASQVLLLETPLGYLVLLYILADMQYMVCSLAWVYIIMNVGISRMRSKARDFGTR